MATKKQTLQTEAVAKAAVSYVSIEKWHDLQDDYSYEVGDIYPRKGLKPNTDRIAELMDGTNPSGLKLIAEAK